ncbi:MULTISPECIES: RsfA family transcriptional regulator [Virgibacillus]|uniref:RsfA family transcriptional regulator n=1 Tax=Virgibacillus TaxID=84406 RepID=UPI0003889B9F|nr:MULTISPECIES: RsfA family transcriptional regulator [Virgibacillus]EQB35862.1 hypothetical protein M948_12545 [Virgibacillus sp. CM-4]
MAKVRQDAWSHEDDLLLAETVLRHIREGSTQLNAFEEVGDKLNRTSAACGFRWNAEIRMKYVNAIDLAKRQRKEKKRAMAKAGQQNTRKAVVSLPQISDNSVTANDNNVTPSIEEDTTLNMDMVIRYLKDIKKQTISSNQSKASLEQMEKENKSLQNQVDTLNKQLEQTKVQLETIQEDYQAFIQIMERARKMTVLDDQSSVAAPAFRMDKNGNLQQLAQGSN